MRIVMMGTPDFAVPCLERLIADGHTIPLVVTQADKPKGRGHHMTPPPVKECALAHGLKVFQPTRLKDEQALQTIREANPDLIVVVAYGKILPKALLELPKHGCINVHGSLLPQYRGAAPIQWAVLDGQPKTGVTTMWMNEGLDTGDMLLKSEREIPIDMTAGELFDALCEDGAQLLSQTITALEQGTLDPQKQDDAAATYAPMLTKEMSAIDWTKPAMQIHNQVRGLHPWPSAVCRYQGKTMKVHKTRPVDAKTDAAAGTVISVSPLTVACGDHTALELVEIQYEGGKRMPSADFLRGHPITIGESF